MSSRGQSSPRQSPYDGLGRTGGSGSILASPVFAQSTGRKAQQSADLHEAYGQRLLADVDDSVPFVSARHIRRLQGYDEDNDAASAADAVELEEMLAPQPEPSASTVASEPEPEPPVVKSNGASRTSRTSRTSQSKSQPQRAEDPPPSPNGNSPKGRSTLQGMPPPSSPAAPGKLTQAALQSANTANGKGARKSSVASSASQDGSAQPSTTQVAVQMDALSMMLADTPMVKLKRRLKQADQLSKAGDAWGLLRVRQEVLGLAKVHCSLSRDSNAFPLVLSSAHYKLAQAYAELGCIPQVSEHCQKAMDELPYHGQDLEQVTQFKRDINVLLGEALLQRDNPQPHVALQHFLMAADVTSIEDIKDLAIRVEACQCCALMGEAKLNEARATQEVRQRQEQAVAVAQEAVNKLAKKVNAQDARIKAMGDAREAVERATLQRKLGESVMALEASSQRLSDLTAELDEEVRFEARLLGEAESQLEKAMDALYDVIPDEEARLEKLMGREEAKKEPLIGMLYRQASEMSLKLSAVYGLKGETKQQLKSLEEVLSAHASYHCIPKPMLARVLKEQGAVLVQSKRYDDALVAYQRLLELQEERLSGETARLALARAECFKLVGGVYVAKRMFNRAREHYEAALELYALQLGPRHSAVSELEGRIDELRSYTDAMAGTVMA